MCRGHSHLWYRLCVIVPHLSHRAVPCSQDGGASSWQRRGRCAGSCSSPASRALPASLRAAKALYHTHPTVPGAGRGQGEALLLCPGGCQSGRPRPSAPRVTPRSAWRRLSSACLGRTLALGPGTWSLRALQVPAPGLYWWHCLVLQREAKDVWPPSSRGLVAPATLTLSHLDPVQELLNPRSWRKPFGTCRFPQDLP